MNTNDENKYNDIFSEGLIVFKDDPASEKKEPENKPSESLPVGEFFDVSTGGPFAEGTETASAEVPFVTFSKEPSEAASADSFEGVTFKEPSYDASADSFEGVTFKEPSYDASADSFEGVTFKEPDNAASEDAFQNEMYGEASFSDVPQDVAEPAFVEEISPFEEAPVIEENPIVTETSFSEEKTPELGTDPDAAESFSSPGEVPESAPQEKKIITFTGSEINRQMDLEDLFTLSSAPQPDPEELTPRKRTITFYNNNADSYYERTISSDMETQYRFFLKYLTAGARILDLGCGSGRDTKYFRDHGYNVVAIDGSEEMCRRAESYTGINVRQMDFLDLNDREIYAGIWASASLLHIEKKDLPRMFAKLRKALTKDGVLYVSFKEGTFEGFRDGRYYTDLTEGELFNLTNTVGGMKVVAAKQFTEERDREEIHWLCAIIKKW